MLTDTKHQRVAHLVLALVASVVIAACGSSRADTVPKTLPKTTTVPTVTSTSPSTSSGVASTTTIAPLTSDAAIFAAVKAESDNFFAVASHNPVKPDDPRIPELAAGKQLGIERNSLTVHAIKRQHDVGTYVQTQLKVAERNATAVIVLSCDFDGIGVADDVTNQIVTPPTNDRSLGNTRLELINGKWMVTDAGQRSPSC